MRSLRDLVASVRARCEKEGIPFLGVFDRDPEFKKRSLPDDWMKRSERLTDDLAAAIADKDALLLQLIEMKGRLGQYEAQFAHDHNLWEASRIGELTAERDAARAAADLSRKLMEREATEAGRLAKLVAMAKAWLDEDASHTESPHPCTCNACYRRKEFRAALAAGKGDNTKGTT